MLKYLFKLGDFNRSSIASKLKWLSLLSRFMSKKGFNK